MILKVFGATHLHSNCHESDVIQPSNVIYSSQANIPGPPISFVALLNCTCTISTAVATLSVLSSDDDPDVTAMELSGRKMILSAARNDGLMST